MESKDIYTQHRNLMIHSWILGDTTSKQYAIIASYKNEDEYRPIEVVQYEIYY